MESVNFKLEVFEGPLELLVHLIEKNKVNICDIPISEILEQYMTYVEEYQRYNLDNISEFLLIASRLVYIKSRMLLPRVEDEEEDPREELVTMISNYIKYKDFASVLKEYKEKNGDKIYVKEPDKVEFDDTYKKKHDIAELIYAYNNILKRNLRKLPPPIQSFTGIVGTKHVSVSSRVFGLLRQLIMRKYISFKRFIYSQKSKSEVIAAFLAVLELSKVKRIMLKDDGPGGDDIRIELCGEELEN